MKAWLRDHARATLDGLRRLASTPMASALNVLVIGVALSLPVGVYLAISQLQSFTRQLTGDPQISIFLELDADARDVDAIEQKLKNESDVGSYRFIPRARALAELKRSAGLSDVLDNLKQNPLPDAFVATGIDSRPQTLERLRDAAAKWPKVAHVQLDSEWARKLDAALRLGRTAILILGLLLSSALVAVTFNTIRLQILTQRAEIEVSKLIGASDAFIRRPFYYAGFLQGVGGGLVALGIVAAALWLLNREVGTLAESYGSNFRFGFPDAREVLAGVGFAGLLGWLGAQLSVSRHLREIEPR